MTPKLFVIISAGLRLAGLYYIAQAVLTVMLQFFILNHNAVFLPLLFPALLPCVLGSLLWIFSKPIAGMVLSGLE